MIRPLHRSMIDFIHNAVNSSLCNRLVALRKESRIKDIRRTERIVMINKKEKFSLIWGTFMVYYFMY